MNKIRTAAALATAAALTLTACGGGDDDTASSDGPREVTVGMLPIVPTAALYAGVDQGFFEDHDITLKIETGQGGAELLPAVVSQEMDFASSNPISLLTARDKGLDVQVVSNWTDELESEDEAINAVLTDDDSIASAKDLEGKTVAINTLRSMGDLTISEAVRKDGGDPSTIKYIELPFPDMPAALAKGTADAVWVPEPFMTGMVSGGSKVVTYPTFATAPGMPTQLMFTSAALTEKDPDLVDDMTAALEETLAYAEENPDDVRAHVPEVNPNIDAKTAKAIRLEGFGTEIPEDQIKTLGELMEQEGWIEKPADVEGLLGNGS